VGDGRKSVCADSLLFAVMVVVAIMARAAVAHPHAGGVVVRGDGTVLAGDILGSRLLVIEPSGRWRAMESVGHVRGLDQAGDGTIYGVSQGSGIWKLGPDESAVPLLPEFHGLFAVRDEGGLVLAAADPLDRRPRLETRTRDGRRSPLARLGQIDALACRGRTVVVADGSAIRSVAFDGWVETLAEGVGDGLHGLVIGPRGPVVTVWGSRRVVELNSDGARRTLLRSEPPWSPTDVALQNGAIYVLEIAQHPCCWKGPRVRRLLPGASPTTLLVFDDGDPSFTRHWGWTFPWALAGVTLLALVASGVAVAIRRVARRRRWRERQRFERGAPEAPGGPYGPPGGP
jgi:hypothetical protein